MLIVTGATGKLGAAIVDCLVALVPAAQIGVSVRDSAKAERLAARGVRVRRGDFADPDSLVQAFEGAERVLIVSSNAAATGGDPLAQHRAAITAARDAGARRILYTSHAAASTTSVFPPARDHAATEDMLRASGVAWTAMRHGFYAEAAPLFMGDWQQSGVVTAPQDGPVAWTTHADLAEGDARLLATDEAPDGPTAPLTAAAALDLSALARIAGEAIGKAIRRDVLTDDAFVERLDARGAPSSAAATALGFYRSARAGEFAAVDPALERLLGRASQTMRSVLEKTGP